MFENETDFKRLVDRLNIDTKPNIAHREKLRRQMLFAFSQTGGWHKPEATVSRFRRIIMVSPIAKIAAAAVIAMAAFIGIHELSGPEDPAVALARIRRATEKMPWMHLVIKERQDQEESVEQHWYCFAAKKTFGISSSGTIWCLDYGAGQKQFYYHPSAKTLTVSDLPMTGLFGADSAYNLLDTVSVYWGEEGALIVQRPEKHNGTDVMVYEIEKTEPGIGIEGKSVAKMKLTFVSDSKKNLIIGGGGEFLDEADSLIARTEWQISYPKAGPRDIYDLGVPRTAPIIDRTTRPIGTPPHEPRLVPTPQSYDSYKLVSFEIELPQPKFVGTKENIRVANLEPVRTKPYPPFLAPVGTRNVALGKPVSSTDEEPFIGEIELITDGDKEAIDGSFVELGPFLQHVTIDLEDKYEIYAIAVWHYHQQPRAYFDVVVQVAQDRDFTTGVKTVFNNDRDNSVGLGVGKDIHYVETHYGKLIDAKAVQGRYVRLYSNGNSSNGQNHYIEVEVFGRPAK
jgi:hypothetical protein